MSASNKQPGKPTPALDFTKCPNWGRGGSYVCDPQTGTRTREEAASDASPEKNQPTAAPAGKAAADKKE